MNEKEKELLDELVFGSKDLKLNFRFLIEHSIDYVNSCEEEDEEPEMSEQFMEFLIFVKSEDHNKKFFETFEKEISKMERMLNEGLHNFSENLDPLQKYLSNKNLSENNNNVILSGLELELEERINLLWNTHINLITFFRNCLLIQENTWDMLKQYLMQQRVEFGY